jgi:hypothetical protein
MRTMLCLFLLFFVSAEITAQTIQNAMVVSGFVRDFEGRAIDSATVMLEDRSFNPAAQAVTDSTGHYRMKVEKRDYYALLAIRMSDYAKSRLEYWAWKIPPADSLSINPRYHRLEVYGINAFAVQGSGSRSIFVYFRPMSLTRQKQWQTLHDTAGTQMHVICPTLTARDIAVTIDGEVSNIVDLSEVREKTKTGFMRGYFVQCALPETKRLGIPSRIVITVTDPENHDRGEGMLFWSGD